ASSLLEEVRHALLFARARGGPAELTARDALEMGTMGGARVLGRDGEIGSRGGSPESRRNEAGGSAAMPRPTGSAAAPRGLPARVTAGVGASLRRPDGAA